MTTNDTLPIKFNLNIIYVTSIGITVLMTVASVAGLIYPDELYPTKAMREAYVVNDAINVLIGIPILLASMWLAWRGKLVGLLLWPGALFYVFYNYVAYIIGIPYNLIHGLYILILSASLYSIIALAVVIEGHTVKGLLSDAVPEKISGGVLAGLGSLYILRVLSILIDAIIYKNPIPLTELAIMIADMLIAPAWIIGGLILWRRVALGYVSGLGLLFQGSTLFIGLILIMLFQPIVTGTRYSFLDILVVFFMGLIVFIPFGLYLKAVLASNQSTSDIMPPDGQSGR